MTDKLLRASPYHGVCVRTTFIQAFPVHSFELINPAHQVKYFGVYSPAKQSISTEMDNDSGR